ncbi:MAG: DUF559 domain-containing protein, partial [Bacteroidia bacterium]|nr:DUF559 domain-containing protein [Bacteroidia bacterium]
MYSSFQGPLSAVLVLMYSPPLPPPLLSHVPTPPAPSLLRKEGEPIIVATFDHVVNFIKMSKFQKFDFRGIKKQAQELRNNMTESEKLLWREIRGKKLSGFRFLRQHPILYKGNLIR